MKLVVDANVIISILVSPSGKTCELFVSDKSKLYTPKYLLEEIKKHKPKILEKSKLSNEELNILLTLVYALFMSLTIITTCVAYFFT